MSSKAGSQLDSLKGILKDSPKKLSLKHKSMGYNLEVSPPGTDPFNYLPVRGAGERDEIRSRAFKPGPYNDRSLRSSYNIVPREDSRGNPKHSRVKSLPIHTKPFR